jgi:hypothetical protein
VGADCESVICTDLSSFQKGRRDRGKARVLKENIHIKKYFAEIWQR